MAIKCINVGNQISDVEDHEEFVFYDTKRDEFVDLDLNGTYKIESEDQLDECLDMSAHDESQKVGYHKEYQEEIRAAFQERTNSG